MARVPFYVCAGYLNQQRQQRQQRCIAAFFFARSVVRRAFNSRTAGFEVVMVAADIGKYS